MLLLSFNKSVQIALSNAVGKTSSQIMRSLDRDMPRCTVVTSHAHGLAAIRRAFGNSSNGGGGGAGGDEETVTDNKVHSVQQAMNELGEHEPTVITSLKTWKWQMAAMLRLLMNVGIECDQNGHHQQEGGGVSAWTEHFIVDCGAKYGIPFPVLRPGAKEKKERAENVAHAHYFTVLRRAFDICLQRTSGFDFTDMVYLPIRLGLALLQFNLVLVDESQDLNAVQMCMISRSIAHGGRVILGKSGRFQRQNVVKRSVTDH